jgi:hypothetical protein
MNRQFSNFTEANWINTYKNSDQLWLSDSLNWEKTSALAFSDTSFVSFLYNSFFVSQHVLTDKISKLSYLDVIILKTNSWNFNVQTLYFSFLNDIYLDFFNLYLPLISLMGSNYQDFFTLIAVISPELNIAISDYFYEVFFFNNVNFLPSAVFDSFTNNLNYFSNDGFVIFIMFFLYVWFIVYFFLTSFSLRWSSFNFSHFNRFFYYFYSISVETRIQLEAVMQTFVFFLFYWIVTLLTFDDDQEEVIEFVDTFFFYFFTIIILYFILRHSIHYFSFLEASVSEGRNVNYLILQFRNDFLGSFSLLLRFYTLLFRMNVYDTLEDFFDSYYIFVGDFDDDEYINELFFSLHNTLFFTLDNHDDRSFLFEDENDFSNDLFFIYFMVWGKFSYFFFLMAELAARLGLAFYILYLILFEVHSVNCSYVEDVYFKTKRLL